MRRKSRNKVLEVERKCDQRHRYSLGKEEAMGKEKRVGWKHKKIWVENRSNIEWPRFKLGGKVSAKSQVMLRRKDQVGSLRKMKKGLEILS